MENNDDIGKNIAWGLGLTFPPFSLLIPAIYHVCQSAKPSKEHGAIGGSANGPPWQATIAMLMIFFGGGTVTPLLVCFCKDPTVTQTARNWCIGISVVSAFGLLLMVAILVPEVIRLCVCVHLNIHQWWASVQRENALIRLQNEETNRLRNLPPPLPLPTVESEFAKLNRVHEENLARIRDSLADSDVKQDLVDEEMRVYADRLRQLMQ